jgi:serine/threonine protein kinase
VAAYMAFQMGDLLVFAMEYVEGDDLAKLVRARGPLPIVNACYFAYQAAQGLQHAHECGMIHRDIKPANLILFRQGKKAVVKILDFGLAKVTSEGPSTGR